VAWCDIPEFNISGNIRSLVHRLLLRTAGLSCLFKQASISRNDLHRCKRYIKGTPSGDIRFNIQQTPRSTIRIPSRFLASATATEGLAMRYILFLLGFESAVVSCTAFPSLRLGARRLSLHHGNPTWRDMSESFAFSSSTSDDRVLTHTAGRSAPSGLRLLWLSILHVDSDRWLVLGQRFRPRLRTPSSGSLLTWKSRIGWTSPCCASKVHGSRQFATIRSASNGRGVVVPDPVRKPFNNVCISPQTELVYPPRVDRPPRRH